MIHRSAFGQLWRLGMITAVLTFACGGCDRSPSEAASQGQAQVEPRVLTTTEPAAYLARRIVGDGVPVECVTPAGESSESWIAGPAAIEQMQQAALVLMNGAGLERWGHNAPLARSRVVRLTEGAPTPLIVLSVTTHSHGVGGAHSHEVPNPYVWLDPNVLRHHAQQARAAIERAFPAQYADANWQTLAADLDRLESDYRQTTEALSGVVVHSEDDRLAYLVRALSSGEHLPAYQWSRRVIYLVQSPAADVPAGARAVVVRLGARQGDDLIGVLTDNLRLIRQASSDP